MSKSLAGLHQPSTPGDCINIHPLSVLDIVQCSSFKSVKDQGIWAERFYAQILLCDAVH